MQDRIGTLHSPRRIPRRRHRSVPGMHAACRPAEAKQPDQQEAVIGIHPVTGIHPDTKIAAAIAVILSIPIAVTLTALIVQLLTYQGLWTWLPWVPPDNVL